LKPEAEKCKNFSEQGGCVFGKRVEYIWVNALASDGDKSHQKCKNFYVISITNVNLMMGFASNWIVAIGLRCDKITIGGFG
jgi:hypothetical protein